MDSPGNKASCLRRGSRWFGRRGAAGGGAGSAGVGGWASANMHVGLFCDAGLQLVRLLSLAKSLAGFFVLLATGLPIAAIADDFMDADRALVSGDYATALATYSRLASNGHWGAQFNLGVMYEQGQGVDRKSVV